MNCEHVHKMLDAHVDGELDEATDAQLAQHLVGCPACERLVAERRALGDAMRRLPRHVAPLALRRDVLRAIHPSARAPHVRRARGASWWQAAGLAGLAAALAFAAGLWIGVPHAIDLREQVIERHVASLAQPSQLVAVASLDRHVVKPWFAGKLDFAPPVRDLSQQGFTLVGGRVDALADRPAAAIVYRVRAHQISLFVSRAQAPRDEPPTASAWRGFSLLRWCRDGLAFTAISDVDPGELRRFGELMLAPD